MIQVFCNCCKQISQNYYNRILSSINIYQLMCPTCRHHGCLIWYGTYKRHVNSEDDDIVLTVNRVLCKNCSSGDHIHTHAILLVSMVPYSQVPMPVQADIIRASEISNNRPFYDILEKNPLIDLNYIYRLLAAYRSFWAERIQCEGIPLLPHENLSERCFCVYSLQFMQIKKIPNVLFKPPT